MYNVYTKKYHGIPCVALFYINYVLFYLVWFLSIVGKDQHLIL